MTTVVIGRKGKPETNMEFHFEYEGAAYGFYADALDSYAEDDFCIDMFEEENGKVIDDAERLKRSSWGLCNEY